MMKQRNNRSLSQSFHFCLIQVISKDSNDVGASAAQQAFDGTIVKGVKVPNDANTAVIITK